MSIDHSEQILTGVAHFLAAHNPAGWQRLLTEHIADQTGHCSTCCSTNTGSPVWPCTLRLVAEHAERLAQSSERTASPGAGDNN